MDNKKVLGKKIQEARVEMGITQKELGDFLDYSPMAISHFENGIREMKVSDIQKMCLFFKKDISFFLQPNTTHFRASIQNNESELNKSLSDFEKFLDEQELN